MQITLIQQKYFFLAECLVAQWYQNLTHQILVLYGNLKLMVESGIQDHQFNLCIVKMGLIKQILQLHKPRCPKFFHLSSLQINNLYMLVDSTIFMLILRVQENLHHQSNSVQLMVVFHIYILGAHRMLLLIQMQMFVNKSLMIVIIIR